MLITIYLCCISNIMTVNVWGNNMSTACGWISGRTEWNARTCYYLSYPLIYLICHRVDRTSLHTHYTSVLFNFDSFHNTFSLSLYIQFYCFSIAGIGLKQLFQLFTIDPRCLSECSWRSSYWDSHRSGNEVRFRQMRIDPDPWALKSVNVEEFF